MRLLYKKNFSRIIFLKKNKIKYFNKISDNLIKKNKNVIDITNIYKYFINNDLIEVVKKEKWFMEEWYVNVLNWWKVVLVPIEWNYSTTNIVNKIKNLKN